MYQGQELVALLFLEQVLRDRLNQAGSDRRLEAEGGDERSR